METFRILENGILENGNFLNFGKWDFLNFGKSIKNYFFQILNFLEFKIQFSFGNYNGENVNFTQENSKSEKYF